MTAATLLYQTLKSTLGYDTVILRTWVTAAGRNFTVIIAPKPLQIDMVTIGSL